MQQQSKLIRKTPLQFAPTLGSTMWLKLENLQYTGSFKLRGACRKVASLAGQLGQKASLVTASAGNHGQGLAAACQEKGLPLVVFVPERTPEVKKAAIAAFGAELRVLGADYDASEALAKDFAQETGCEFVSAFDDETVILGNGHDLGLEILEQRPSIQRVVCPVGGGGLIGGLCQSLARSGIEVVGVQPANNCAMYDSLSLGRALTQYQAKSTIAEGCEGAVAVRTYQLCQEYGAMVELVSEDEIREAIVFAYRELALVCEASAAVAIAYARRLPDANKKETAVVVSGGNIQPSTLNELLART